MEKIKVLETNDYKNALNEKIEIDEIEIASDYIVLVDKDGEVVFHLAI